MSDQTYCTMHPPHAHTDTEPIGVSLSPLSLPPSYITFSKSCMDLIMVSSCGEDTRIHEGRTQPSNSEKLWVQLAGKSHVEAVILQEWRTEVEGDTNLLAGYNKFLQSHHSILVFIHFLQKKTQHFRERSHVTSRST